MTVSATAGSPALHRNNFNFLRLLLASLVLVSHSFELIDGDSHREPITLLFGTLSFGQLAVNGFFMLSGYLIVQSWLSQPAALSFLWKRVLRIYPGFIVCSLVCAYVVGPLGANPDQYFDQFNPFAFVNGLFFLSTPQVPRVFAGHPYPAVNGSMWTIAYEFWCYLLVLLAGLPGLLRHRVVWLLCTLSMMAGSLAETLGHHLPLLPQWFPRWIPLDDNFIQMSAFFFVGGCFYLYRDHVHYRRRWLAVALPLLFAGMFSRVLAQPSLALLGGYLLFYTGFAPLPALRRLQTLPDVSYGIYLYGWTVQKLLIWYIAGITPLELMPLAYCGALLLALLSWYLVEKPCLSLKSIRRRRVAVA